MSDQHGRFSAWLRGPRADEPPRDAALHAAYCPDCRRSIAAFDALDAVNLGAAPLPPVGGAAVLAEPISFEPPVRWMLGLLAIATLALVAAIVVPGALRRAGDTGLAGAPNPGAEGGVLGQLGTPSPRPSDEASDEPSTIRIGQKIPSTLEGATVVPSGPAPTEGPPVIFAPPDVPFASSFPFPSFSFPPFTFVPGPTPTGQPTLPASASPSASASSSSLPSPTGTTTSAPTATAPPTPTAAPTATSVPTPTPSQASPTPPPPPPTPTPPPSTPPPTPTTTPGPFDSASCFDGTDNDGDGAVDSQDPGCNPLLVLAIGEGFLDPIL